MEIVKEVGTEKTLQMSKYCAMPFKFATFLQTGEQIVCNPTWNNHPSLSGNTVQEKFNSPEINAIRESILDGSYSYCNDNCPYLRTYREGGSPRPFIEKDKLGTSDVPTHVELCEDNVCNLACPTCRTDFIIESTQQRNSFEEVKSFSDKIEFLGATTSGDPLYSKKSFEFLKSINSEDFPALKHIKIHTNGLLLRLKWPLLEHLSGIVDLNISVDAATKDTYEVVRKGGNWDLLIKNLEYINTQEVANLTIWYCVHDLNFREMQQCYDLMEEIFKDKNVRYNFFTVEHWSQPPDIYKRQKIDNLLHPEFRHYQTVVKEFTTNLEAEIKAGKISHNL